MDSTEAIVAIHRGWLNGFALAIRGKHGALVELYIDVGDFLHAHEAIEAEIALGDLVLVVLHHSRRVDAFHGDTERVSQLGILRLLHLEFGDDEGVLGEFRLSLFLH